MQPKANDRLALCGLFLLGLAVRIAVSLVLGIAEPPSPGSDQKEFDTYAWNVAQGRGYRGMSPDVADQDHLTAYRPPSPALVWAALYIVFGHRYDVVRIMHCLVGAASVLLVYGVGLRAYNRHVGLASAAIYSIYPTALIWTVDLLSEALGTFWLLAYVLASLQFAERPTWRRASAAGVLLGLSLLTRPSTVLMLPLAGLWAGWQFRGRWRAAAHAVVIPTIALATLIPWTARNYHIFGAFIPFSTQGGSALLQGNNRIVAADGDLSGYVVWDTEIPEYRDALRSANDELERDRRAGQFAVQWLKANPDKWGHLFLAKFRRAWSPFLATKSPMLYRVAMLVSWGPVLALFVLAFAPTLVIALRQRDPVWIMHLAIVHYAITAEIFYGYVRYRSVIEPFCIILSARAVQSFLTRFGARRRGAASVVARTSEDSAGMP